jgi:hypothetical protein
MAEGGVISVATFCSYILSRSTTLLFEGAGSRRAFHDIRNTANLNLHKDMATHESTPAINQRRATSLLRSILLNTIHSSYCTMFNTCVSELSFFSHGSLVNGSQQVQQFSHKHKEILQALVQLPWQTPLLKTQLLLRCFSCARCWLAC